MTATPTATDDRRLRGGATAPSLRHRRISIAQSAKLPAVLTLVVIVQAILLTTLGNGPFQDEALYVEAGHDLWRAWTTGATPTADYSSFFSGLPGFYPLIAAGLDAVGGLELVRLLSSVCTLWLTVVVFLVARNLIGGRGALFAAVAFVGQPSVLFIGRLATYDAFSLALLGTGLTIATMDPRWWRTLLLVFVIGAAPVAKYATAAFVPTAVVFCIVLMLRRGGAAALRRQLAIAGSSGVVVGAVLAALILKNPKLTAGLALTTTDRTVLNRETAWELVLHALPLIGPVLLAAAVGLGWLFVRGGVTVGASGRRPRPTRHPSRVFGAIALATMLLAPSYHVITGEQVSFDKHMAFGVLFGAFLVGYALERTAAALWMSATQVAALSIAALVVLTGSGLREARLLYTTWPDSAHMTSVLRTVVRSDDTRVLAEEMEVPRYELRDVTAGWQWTGLDAFSYTNDGQSLTGDDAYQAAVRDHYFGVVVLRFGPSASTASSIERELDRDSTWLHLASTRFSTAYGPGAYQIWVSRKVAPPAE